MAAQLVGWPEQGVSRLHGHLYQPTSWALWEKYELMQASGVIGAHFLPNEPGHRPAPRSPRQDPAPTHRPPLRTCSACQGRVIMGPCSKMRAAASPLSVDIVSSPSGVYRR